MHRRQAHATGGYRRRLRGLGFLRQGGGLLLLLLQGLSQFGSGRLCRLLLLHGFIAGLLRLRGLGLDLATRPRLRCLGFLRQGGGFLLLLLQGFSQLGSGRLRRLLGIFRPTAQSAAMLDRAGGQT